MLKNEAKNCLIKEQWINDEGVSGVTLVFRVTPSGEARLHISGSNLPYGNRDFQFNKDGELVGTGTGLCPCKIEDN